MCYVVKWYPFTEHPTSDSCWSLSTGPDGRIYAAACCEHTPGGIVKLTRYDDRTDSIEYLFDLDEVVGDPRDSGRATQCKIHYSFAPSPTDGVLYMATHLSGPPFDESFYSPWRSWHDPKRCFRGAALVAFDTGRDTVLWHDTLIPKEGCRCLALDDRRGILYAISYPRDHLIAYDLETRTRRDLGRIGSVNAQALFLDRRGRIWTTDDCGHLVRYDPAVGRIERSPYVLPHDRISQTGWHSVFYDATPAPGGECVYAATWVIRPHLMRIWPDDGPWGRVEDLGAATQDRDPTCLYDTGVDHCGGLAFGPDGQLYFVASRWPDENGRPVPRERRRETSQGVVWRLDPKTLERTEVAVLVRPDGSHSSYATRGALDRNGDLFFGNIGWWGKVGFFRLVVPEGRGNAGSRPPLRMWG